MNDSLKSLYVFILLTLLTFYQIELWKNAVVFKLLRFKLGEWCKNFVNFDFYFCVESSRSSFVVVKFLEPLWSRWSSSILPLLQFKWCRCSSISSILLTLFILTFTLHLSRYLLIHSCRMILQTVNQYSYLSSMISTAFIFIKIKYFVNAIHKT